MNRKSKLGIAATTALTLSARESHADFYEALEPKQSHLQTELQTRGEYDYDNNDELRNIIIFGLKAKVYQLYLATRLEDTILENNIDGSLAQGTLDQAVFEAGGFSPSVGAWSFLATTRYTHDFNTNEDYFGSWLKTTAVNQKKGFTFDAGVGLNNDLDGFTSGIGKAGDNIGLQATLGNYVGKHWLVGVEDVGEFYLLRDNAYSVQIRSLVRYDTKEWALTGFTGVNLSNVADNPYVALVSGLSLKVGGIVQRE